MRYTAALTALALETAVVAACGSAGGDSDASSPAAAGDADADASPVGPAQGDASSWMADADASAGEDSSRDTGMDQETGGLLDAPQEGSAACAPGPPPGAAALGFHTPVICFAPTIADISYTSSGNTSLYSGEWYDTTVPDATHYSMQNGVLSLSLGGSLATQRQNSQQGELPYLAAANGFYVEFAVTLSDNDGDHWPAVWLMPQEHDGAQHDHVSTDPAGYERWLEIDCDEGGFYSGALHSLINWEGVWPNYTNTTWNNYNQLPALDRAVEHVFGVSYDPVGQVVQYWLDGAKTWSHGTSAVPPIVNTYHYYLIVSAQTHGASTPYQMLVRHLSAWVP